MALRKSYEFGTRLSRGAAEIEEDNDAFFLSSKVSKRQPVGDESLTNVKKGHTSNVNSINLTL
jgi:hypothetical protein